jgi:hypothetical protein
VWAAEALAGLFVIGVPVMLSWRGLTAIALTGMNLLVAHEVAFAIPPRIPARLAIYYGYPSLVNGANGDVEKAASVFSVYDVVVLGDGIEFRDQESGRFPPGDPEEHQKALRIIAAVRNRSTRTRFYGYVCLGEIPSAERERTSLTPKQLEERIRLWKEMGVAGIFLDEAGYDFPVVTRERQNMAVRIIHDLGLRAFLNAYFLDHLFSADDKLPYASGTAKNPKHLPPLLDERDMFLLESFQVNNGTYESVSAWRARLNQGLEFRRRYGSHIYATTTTTELQPFDTEKFNYAWWTALLFGLDGFGWGEPNFAAVSNELPDRRCRLESAMLHALQTSDAVNSDNTFFWRKAGNSFIVVDTRNHSVRRVPSAGRLKLTEAAALFNSPQATPLLTCGEIHER